jgi:hypothetical protein
MPWMEKAAFVPVAIAIAVAAAIRQHIRAGLFVRIIVTAPPERRQSLEINSEKKNPFAPSGPVHITRATHPQLAAIVVLSELVVECP